MSKAKEQEWQGKKKSEWKYWKQCDYEGCKQWFGTDYSNKINCSNECREKKHEKKKKAKTGWDDDKPCVICSKLFKPKRANQMTCSDECSYKRDLERKKERQEEMIASGDPQKDKRECVICEKWYSPESFNQLTCSDKCRVEYKRRKGKLRRAKRKEVADELREYEEPTTVEELIEHEERKLKEQIGKQLIKQKLQEMAGAKILLDGILEAIIPIEPEVLNDFVEVRKTKKKSKKKLHPETATLVISDLHMGKKTPSYDISVFKLRLRGLVSAIKHIVEDILRQSYQIDTLKVIFDGDIVDGDSIYKTQPWHLDEHVMYQIYRTGVPELCWMLSEFSQMFNNVDVEFVPGNHGRVGRFEPEELNFDTILAESIKLAMSKFDNVNINVAWDWYSIVEIEGHNFLVTHGETIRMYLNIPWYGATQKAMRWSGSLPEDWEYLILAHFHVIQMFKWNDKWILCNGCWPTDDDFSLKVIGMAGTPYQHFFGVHPDKGITWHYDLDLVMAEQDMREKLSLKS